APLSSTRADTAGLGNQFPNRVPGMIIEGGEIGYQYSQQNIQNDLMQSQITNEQSKNAALTPRSTKSTVARPERLAIAPVQMQNQSLSISRSRRSNFPPLPELSGLDKIGVDLGPLKKTSSIIINNLVGPSENDINTSYQSSSGAAETHPLGLDKPTEVIDAALNGYVTVISTKLSRIDALTTFVDLQQLYPSILGSKTPDVRSADLTDRGLGIMYRAVVGPPGSRLAAFQLCSRLKEVGYSNCWVAPY
ncbi:MAG: SPOR domain-containing protein, partial [Hyphomicrobiaceae bacterium]|nr:SPOR domain-containing protein [Hyphomicrobiaceae bacterium]